MTKIIAHRGARNLWAENSLQGFRNTRDLNVGAVEFDLHLGANGELLVIHDATLDRTTTGTGPACVLNDTSRHDVRLIGPDGEIDEGVPVLSEVLDILAPVSGLQLLPEFKADENGLYDPEMIEKTVELLREKGLASRTTLHSFDVNVLRKLKAAAPEFDLMVSVNRVWVDRQGGIEAFFETVRDLVSFVSVQHELFEAEYDRITQLLPLEQLCVWTVNDQDLITRWLSRGPGFMTSDNPKLAQELQAGQVAA
ncbi:glycerophosphodiester phosphodiesterase family protein [Roseobacter sp. N2S]|uniref:glycerophosphodiester phosphodiesterase family protein n=1 Tax=Roseobacter sp. N2S TaxID=2663844 RepID=UPI002864D97C|nr:glycerophosphodiester phosphodiesterase family protein [Roseobacter sp. N2S]MDR6263266.1 glycerophosphoryl diester phosphodiesterase [Roseobacter sp. N2S]